MPIFLQNWMLFEITPIRLPIFNNACQLLNQSSTLVRPISASRIFQLDRLNAVVQDTSNQLNRSTGKVIELQSTVLNLSSLRDVLFDFINSIRSKFLPNLPSFTVDNFSSLSPPFLSELYRRIAPPWSGPDPRIAQLQVQVDELTEANQSYAREARSRHHLL